MLFTKKSVFGLAGALMIASHAAMAAVTVTIEDPGVMSANPAIFGAGGSLVETFDSAATGALSNYSSALGTYSAGDVFSANRYGGADATQFFSVNGSPGSLLTLTQSATYFGFWWSAGNAGNIVELISGGFNIFTFNSADVVDYLNEEAADASAYYGNPTPEFLGQAPSEPYVFINLFSDQAFDSVRLSGPGFESDNHTIAANITAQSGTDIAAVPAPAALPLLAAALGACGLVSRRRKSAAPASA